MSSGELCDFIERGILWQERKVWVWKGSKDGFEGCQECINVKVEYCISVVWQRLIVGDLYVRLDNGSGRAESA